MKLKLSLMLLLLLISADAQAYINMEIVKLFLFIFFLPAIIGTIALLLGFIFMAKGKKSAAWFITAALSGTIQFLWVVLSIY